MFTTAEQFSEATKAGFGAQYDTFSAFSGKALDNFEKVIGLNLSLAKATFEESTTTAKQLFSAKDPQEFFAVGAAQIQPNAQKAITYSRHLATIASDAQAEFTKAAEQQIAENNRKVLLLIDEVSKNAPAGSESTITLLKTTIGNLNAGFDQVSKTTKQAVDTIETNLASAVDQFAQTAENVSARAKK